MNQQTNCSFANRDAYSILDSQNADYDVEKFDEDEIILMTKHSRQQCMYIYFKTILPYLVDIDAKNIAAVKNSSDFVQFISFEGDEESFYKRGSPLIFSKSANEFDIETRIDYFGCNEYILFSSKEDAERLENLLNIFEH